MNWDKIKILYGYSDYEIKLIQYTIIAILSEVSKFIILLIFFSSISKTCEFFTAITVLLLLRCNAGGFHFKHYFMCLFATFILLLLSVCILPQIFSLGILPIMFFLFICIILNYIIGPIPASNKPFPDYALIIRSKINSFTFIFLYLILAYIIQNHPLITVGFWTIILQTLQLVFACLFKHKGGIQHNEKINEVINS